MFLPRKSNQLKCTRPSDVNTCIEREPKNMRRRRGIRRLQRFSRQQTLPRYQRPVIPELTANQDLRSSKEHITNKQSSTYIKNSKIHWSIIQTPKSQTRPSQVDSMQVKPSIHQKGTPRKCQFKSIPFPYQSQRKAKN